MSSIVHLGISLEKTNDVQDICRPLFETLQINFFRFMRLYNNGYRITLTTNRDWTQYFYEYELYKLAWFDNQTTECYQNAYEIWDAKIPHQDNQVGIDSRNIFNMHHGLSIIKKSTNWCEFYDFTTNKENHIINDLYLHNSELFERFIFYFKDKAQKLIQECENKKILLEINKPINQERKLILSDEVKEDFFNATEIKRYYFNQGSNEEFLTKREAECIYWYTQGKTAAEIGLILNMTKRTAEVHLSNIKNKFNCYKISNVIKKLSETGLLSILMQEFQIKKD